MNDARLTAAAAVALAFSVAGAGCHGPKNDSTAPKPIPGVTFLGDKMHTVRVFDLSADGRAAVGYVFDATKEPPPGAWTDSAAMPDYAHSFFWTAAGGLKIIRARDGGDVEVRAISADGKAAVGRFYDKASWAHVFRWTESGGLEDLGAPDKPYPVHCMHGGCGAEARTVSADGGVIFGRLWSGGSYGAFRWTRATGFRNLHLPGEIAAATPDGSTAVGVPSVQIAPGRAANHVFRWTPTRGFEDLGAPPAASPDPDYSVDVRAVSADGSTIVGEYEPKGGGSRAYRWRRSDGFRDLPADGYSEARDVSGDGARIVGIAFASKGRASRAVIWQDSGTPQQVGPPELHAMTADRISADGRTVAGRVTNEKGERQSFLLRQK